MIRNRSILSAASEALFLKVLFFQDEANQLMCGVLIRLRSLYLPTDLFIFNERLRRSKKSATPLARFSLSVTRKEALRATTQAKIAESPQVPDYSQRETLLKYAFQDRL